MPSINASAATVRHVTKDHVVIRPAPGYSVVVFNLKNGDVEAMVASDDGSETIRLLIAGPGPDQHMAIRTRDGVVDIRYQQKEEK